jgi:hypothetical protein
VIVKELIALLQEQDQDAEVVIRNYEGSGFGGFPVFCSHPITSWEPIRYEKSSVTPEGVNEVAFYWNEPE